APLLSLASHPGPSTLLPLSLSFPSPSFPPSLVLSFFFNHTSTTEIYTLSLHDALPICRHGWSWLHASFFLRRPRTGAGGRHAARSEEHTSELQSRFDLVCRLLLEKKKIHSSNGKSI